MQVLFDSLCNGGQRELGRDGIQAIFQSINGSLEAKNKAPLDIDDEI